MWCRSHGIYHQQTNDLPTNVLKFCPEVTQNTMFSCQKEELDLEHSTEPQTQEIQMWSSQERLVQGKGFINSWQQNISEYNEVKSKEVHFFLQSKDEPNKTGASLTRCCSNKPEFIGVHEKGQEVVDRRTYQTYFCSTFYIYITG